MHADWPEFLSPGSQRARVMERFARARERGEFLVGAAIGAGLLGDAAERGGADFLVALNAGRFRLMGASSVACILPIRDANQFVLSFAPLEILSQCRIPVYFGASTLDPALSLEALVAEIADLGFAGVANFPSVVHLPAPVRHALDGPGLGFERELELLALAHRHGLSSLAYVRTREQASAAAARGVDIICYNVGWNAGGAKGPVSEISVEETAAHAREMHGVIRRENPRAFFFLEGGPIQDPDQLAAVCRVARMHGYIGGSTIDRLPLAQSVSGQTQRFKSATALARILGKQERMLVDLGRRHGFVGASEAMIDVYEALDRFRRSSFPMLISGERNTGRQTLIEALHGESRDRRGSLAVIEADDGNSGRQAMIALFGRAAVLGGAGLEGLASREDIGMIALRGIEHVPLRLQRRLANTLKRGRFVPFGDRRGQRWTKRLMLVSDFSLKSLLAEGRIDPQLAELLSGHEIRLPPLRKRTEDIEDLLGRFMAGLAGEGQPYPVLSPGAMSLLRRHDWPGNLLELRSFASRLFARHGAGRVDEEAALGLLSGDSDWMRRRMSSERDILLDALWRHGFHRGKTAAFLGISRKTLYNKIRRYRLTSQV